MSYCRWLEVLQSKWSLILMKPLHILTIPEIQIFSSRQCTSMLQKIHVPTLTSMYWQWTSSVVHSEKMSYCIIKQNQQHRDVYNWPKMTSTGKWLLGGRSRVSGKVTTRTRRLTCTTVCACFRCTDVPNQNNKILAAHQNWLTSELI